MKKGTTNNPNGQPRKYDEPTNLNIRVESTELEQWRKAAELSGENLTQYVRKTLNQAHKSQKNIKADNKAEA